MAGIKKTPIIAAAVAGVLLIVGIRLLTNEDSEVDGVAASPGTSDPVAESSSVADPVVRTGCTTVTVVASSEKAALMAGLAADYGTSGRTVDEACFDIAVRSIASGTAESVLAKGWDETVDGPAPDVWSPAASTWISLLRSDLTSADQPDILPAAADIESIASTPLVLAMPQPMATALGWPDAELGWSDILGLIEAPDGWASKGHPEWGAFTLGKTNPTVSTSGLAATIGTMVAATGKSSDLTAADLENPEVREFARAVEASVIHYGDTTLTYLTNLQKADDGGAAMSYVSAVAIEEKSVLDYNAGNPSGDPATLGEHAPPREKLVAIYPKEGTLSSDNPYAILQAPWVTAEKRAGAQDFLDYLQQPAQQQRFVDAGFRTHDGKAGALITSSDAVRADGVTIMLDAPGPTVLPLVRNLWDEVRKPARVLVLMDVSGSMQNPAGGTGLTRLDLAKQAAAQGMDQLSDADLVGLWSFTTDMPTESTVYSELVPVADLGTVRPAIQDHLQKLLPSNGTPLYAVIRAATDYMDATYDPALINAVVVMTDGKNEYPADTDIESLVNELDDASLENGVRVFSIAYGEGSDLKVLQRLSEASRAAAYDAQDPETIDAVFSAVLSNF